MPNAEHARALNILAARGESHSRELKPHGEWMANSRPLAERGHHHLQSEGRQSSRWPPTEPNEPRQKRPQAPLQAPRRPNTESTAQQEPEVVGAAVN
jgi:hypothetical protein